MTHAVRRAGLRLLCRAPALSVPTAVARSPPKRVEGRHWGSGHPLLGHCCILLEDLHREAQFYHPAFWWSVLSALYFKSVTIHQATLGYQLGTPIQQFSSTNFLMLNFVLLPLLPSHLAPSFPPSLPPSSLSFPNTKLNKQDKLTALLMFWPWLLARLGDCFAEPGNWLYSSFLGESLDRGGMLGFPTTQDP